MDDDNDNNVDARALAQATVQAVVVAVLLVHLLVQLELYGYVLLDMLRQLLLNEEQERRGSPAAWRYVASKGDNMSRFL